MAEHFEVPPLELRSIHSAVYRADFDSIRATLENCSGPVWIYAIYQSVCFYKSCAETEKGRQKYQPILDGLKTVDMKKFDCKCVGLVMYACMPGIPKEILEMMLENPQIDIQKGYDYHPSSLVKKFPGLDPDPLHVSYVSDYHPRLYGDDGHAYNVPLEYDSLGHPVPVAHEPPPEARFQYQDEDEDEDEDEEEEEDEEKEEKEDQDPSLNADCQDEWTPMHVLALTNQVDKLRILLEHPRNRKRDPRFGVHQMNARGIDNMTPLHVAVYNGHKETILYLMSKRGIVTWTWDVIWQTQPFTYSCRLNDLQIIQLLAGARDVNLNFRERHGTAAIGVVALHHRIREGEPREEAAQRVVEITNYLLSLPKLDPNYPSPEGADLMNIVAVHSYFAPELLEMFLPNPRINVERRNSRGCTPFNEFCSEPFHNLSGEHYLRCLDLFMKCPRITLNSRDNAGKTPLFNLCASYAANRETRILEAIKIMVMDHRVEVDLSGNDCILVERVAVACLPDLLSILIGSGRAYIVKPKPTTLLILDMDFSDPILDRNKALLRRWLEHRQAAEIEEAARNRMVFPTSRYLAMMVLLKGNHEDRSDAIIRISAPKPEDTPEAARAKRFFQITNRLPLDIIIIMARRASGLPGYFIPAAERREGIRNVANSLRWGCPQTPGN